MGRISIRSLLLAAIVICNSITWTSSRHHYTHNVNGHRIRHRRQGAKLYLSASYVIPGGEGSGAWGEWGAESPCSRTCGGGVASQKRICLEVGPDGQPLCTGGDTKYFSCETQDCPEGSGDFRSEQCAAFNDKLFRGIKYDWIPYTKSENPCQLNCMPRNDRFYYRHKEKVVDGTLCNTESFDVCVDGTCQPVGCDMMLGSRAQENKCRVCRGNDTDCNTFTGLIDTLDLRQGYNDILLIPQGATNIDIAEIAPSDNYLAIRAKQSNVYYLNGGYRIDFPQSISIAGCLWNYERSTTGLASPDKLRCLGPTTEPLYLSILLMSQNVGIKYEYSVPSSMAMPPDQQYHWVHEQFGSCSASCGGGYQVREVSCRSREDLDVVDEKLCDEALRPVANTSCNVEACPPRWAEGPWGSCSKPCGEGGTRSRQVHCEKVIINGYPSMVNDKECFDSLGPKPELYQECNKNASCPTWFTGPWKACDKLCGEGKQTRQVVCHQRVGGRVQVFPDEECQDEKPEAEQPCMAHPCDGVDWVLTEWTGCDTCLSKVRSREALCVTKGHEVVDPKYCEYHPQPVLEEPCDKTKLKACDVLWYATQWGNCSVECGKGVKTRRVFCGMFDGTSVLKVEDDRCDPKSKYNDTAPCEIPKDKCPAKWFAGPWSECTAKCGSGEQFRRVWCFNGDEESRACDGDVVPDDTQPCNTIPCDKDEMLPVDSKTTPIMDDDYDTEECVEEDDYPEEAIDESSNDSSNYDQMVSDGPDSNDSDLGGGFVTDSGFEITHDLGSGSPPSDIIDEGSGMTDFTDTSVSESETTDSTISTFTDTTESTVTAIGSTTESVTTEMTGTTETGTTESTETGTTGTNETESTETLTTAITESTESRITETTVSNTVETTGSGTTESLMTETGSTESTESGTTGTTVSEITDTTESVTTESLITETGSTQTTETGTTETTVSGSTDTTESVTTESLITETGSTETTETGTTETTVSGITDTTESVTTESLITETGSTETTETGTTESVTTASLITETGSTETTETGTTETTVSGITDTTESVTTESLITETGSTETTESGTTGTTVSGITDTTESVTTESLVTETGSTETTETGTTETTVSGITESVTTESLITETGSTETTETGFTETTVSGTTDITESGTTESLITEIGSTETTEPVTTETTVSGITDTTESVTTESLITETGSTETTETGTTETTVSGITETTESVTTESLITETGSTETMGSVEVSTTEVPWSTKPKLPRCKPRKKIPKCSKSKFGCCPDKRTTAAGPFDEGCPTATTCKESEFKCCPDGVSAASGPDGRGCPAEPCAATLYGCCADNVTAAQGNDQEGCPPPPPACQASKYGCCADNTTAATGPKRKGCPEKGSTTTTKPEKQKECGSSQFGCCADNKTEAAGPDGAGCPCAITEFGCCPDGVSPASGPQMEGCVMSCNTSAYGCCPDGQTPAHGPDAEGCCLLYPFGCCRDNYKPAEGPHLEGCGCEHAHFGCCPDNVTVARGPRGEGCGCGHSEHGCCPDGHTEASGPDYEGCGCHTYQFGCCSDGVTIAAGPREQGCLCQQSEFGCCEDEVTAARGPDQAGCDCSASKYGCCPDGVTKALGEKFLNCTDVPENRQEACALGTDRGPCYNYTVNWFYDTQFGGCSRFWYGGCEGNGNRFLSKEECEDVCVQPAPKDACKLPQVKGPCPGYNLKWYYDAARAQCSQFVYSGCLGNANNFESLELCQKQCNPEQVEGQCNLPIEQGSCNGNFVRWGFADGRCKQFLWGGCEGNSNRFPTEAACLMRCDPPGKPKPVCSETQEAGNCTEKHPVWAFSQTENRCMPFYYTGCGGNGNRFESENDCAQTCPSEYEPELCTLPASPGECGNYTERWFYDTREKRCRTFYYGGCGGNQNNFATQQECEGRCSQSLVTTTAAPPPPPPVTDVGEPELCTLPSSPGECGNYTERWFYDTKEKRCRTFYYGGCGGNQNNFATQQECEGRCSQSLVTTTAAPPPPPPVTDVGAICFLERDPGPCDANEQRWAYSSARGRCEPFTYGGCGGNQNNFPTHHHCLEYCQRAQDVCQLPMMSGPCNESVMQWFYDTSSDRCSLFTYGGCDGNDNRFNSQEECERRCRTGPEQPVATTTISTPTTIIPPVIRLPPKCDVSPYPEACNVSGRVWRLDERRATCVPHDNPATGQQCRYQGTFPSEEACERNCGAFRDLDVCYYDVDPGPCQSLQPKFYYDRRSDRCAPFAFGGCHGGPNRFSSAEECEQVCRTTKERCQQAVEMGNCLGTFWLWYYNEDQDDCLQFMYSGCNGNENRFESREECMSSCARQVDRSSITTTTTTTSLPPAAIATTTTLSPLETVSAECRQPPTLEACGANVTVYYYDERAGACLSGQFGACRYPNAYRSEEECERRCGTFRGLDVCTWRLDPGPCTHAVLKVFFDAATGRCRQFQYGGCHGGPNRFSSVEECEQVCGGAGPEAGEAGGAGCLQPVETGTAGCAGAARRWHYSEPHGECRPFAFLGCGGNLNNFLSYEDCSALCLRTARPEPCEQYEKECASLRCEYGIQRIRTSDDCERCVCVNVDVNCDTLEQDCENLKCAYGKQRSTGEDGCPRCSCLSHPCADVACPAAERCVPLPARDPLSGDVTYTTHCRLVNKTGSCPAEESTEISSTVCRRQCNDDADCPDDRKCCERGCSQLCLLPAATATPDSQPSPLTSNAPVTHTTYVPDLPMAPVVNSETKTSVDGKEGGVATLSCLFHSNPPPSITWRRGEITISSDMGRYRLRSDGSLQIVSLYRNDTGVYICVADNGLGIATQEIRLEVNDPVPLEAHIAGEPGAEVAGELGRPLHVRCLAYGHPEPTIYWFRGDTTSMLPYSSAQYEARNNVLLIKRLTADLLGRYICQAYNGVGKSAEWEVMVRAGERLPDTPATPATPGTTGTTPTEPAPAPDLPVPVYTVAVRTRIVAESSRVSAGAVLSLPCEVDGYPIPDVYWTKDAERLVSSDRMQVTEARLTILRTTVDDSGVYGCHASNRYSSHYSTVQIYVEGVYLPAKCTDNIYFADCRLIVRSRYCKHAYYSKFCCKSCVEAGQLDPLAVDMQADEPFYKKK